MICAPVRLIIHSLKLVDYLSVPRRTNHAPSLTSIYSVSFIDTNIFNNIRYNTWGGGGGGGGGEASLCNAVAEIRVPPF